MFAVFSERVDSLGNDLSTDVKEGTVGVRSVRLESGNRGSRVASINKGCDRTCSERFSRWIDSVSIIPRESNALIFKGIRASSSSVSGWDGMSF